MQIFIFLTYKMRCYFTIYLVYVHKRSESANYLVFFFHTMERELTFIRVVRERSHRNSFFNANCVEYQIQIRDPDSVDVPFTTIDEWYLSVFEEILEFGLAHAEPWHYVGIRVSIPDLENTRAIGISFRPIHSLTSEMVVDMLAGVIQSNESFGIASRIEISMTVVQVPNAGRPIPLHKLNKHNLLASKKRCIVVPRNLSLTEASNNMCLPTALVIGRALADKSSKAYIDSLIRRNSRVLRIERNKLIRKANVCVDAEVGCILNDVVKFAHAMKKYEIIIYDSFTDANSILFSTPKRDLKIFLFLLPEERHFITLSRVAGFFGYSYMCEHCDVMYHNLNAHKCLAVCSFCRQFGICPPVTNLIKCLDCNRSFRGDLCMSRHLNFPCTEPNKKKKAKSTGLDPAKNTVCEQLKICSECFYFIDYRKISEHKCTDRYCSNCREIVDESHLCYMKPYTKKAPQKYAIIFYDFETTAEDKYLDRDDEYEHKANLCRIIEQ